MEIIGQEVSGDAEVEIPEPLRDVYRLWQPSPLFRAHRFERELDTPAHIYSVLAGRLEDPEFSEADMEAALERLPEAPAIA